MIHPEPDPTSALCPRRRRREQGSTFAELMLATIIVATTIVGASSSLSTTAQVYDFFKNGPHDALMLAQEIHEAATSLPWDGADADSFTFGPAETLWDLDGVLMSPPKSALYDEVVSHPNWTQYVRIHHVDLNHPTVVVDPLTFEGETLVQLRVWVWNPQWEDLEGFTWWLSEPEKEA